MEDGSGTVVARAVGTADRDSFATEFRVPGARKWGIDGKYGEPTNRYTLVINSSERVPFAFRDVKIKGRRIFLNGEEFTIQGSSFRCAEYCPNSACDNQYYFAYHSEVLRRGNVNFLRFHRFNLQADRVRACDDAGIVAAGEAPWWGLYTPRDINGDRDYDDPVWNRNCEEWHRAVIGKFRNSPSMLFFSLENETMKAENHAALARFRRVAEETAPHIIFYAQSIATMDAPENPIAVVHDYGVGYDAIGKYAQTVEKPFVVGEYWNYKIFMNNSVAAQAKGAVRQTADYFRKTIRKYRALGADGVMPYGIELSGITGSLDRPGHFGPWEEFTAKRPLPRYSVPVEWPAMTGNGGYRIPRLVFADSPGEFGQMRRTYLNFWDPARPAFTQTAALDGLRDAFGTVPKLTPTRAPALLVTVMRGGAPVAGTNVFVGQDGAKTDADGRAFVTLPAGGAYAVRVGDWTGRVEVAWHELGKPGWDWVDRLAVDLKTGAARFTAGRSSAAELPPNDAGEMAVVVKKDTAIVAEKFEPVPLKVGAPIREWLVLGPFPNPGERPDCPNFERDFLGGEATAEPRAGAEVATEFSDDDTVPWNAGKVVNRWQVHRADGKGKVDLGRALRRDDVPGLDVTPLNCVLGYAYALIDAPAAGDYTLELTTYSGVKIWLNGAPVLTKHFHTFSRDPASPILPPTKLQRYAVNVRLAAGVNRLLVKQDTDYGEMVFMVRIVK